MRELLLFSLFLFLACQACAQPRRDANLFPFENSREVIIREMLRRAGRELRSGSKNSLLRAQSEYEFILELRPFDPRALDGLGCVAFRLGRNLAAEWYFKKSYEKNPGYDRSLEHLAALQVKEGDLSLAESLYRQAIAINPLNYRARNNLSLLLSPPSAPESPEKGEAIRQLLKAQALFLIPAPELAEDLGPLEANSTTQFE